MDAVSTRVGGKVRRSVGRNVAVMGKSSYVQLALVVIVVATVASAWRGDPPVAGRESQQSPPQLRMKSQSNVPAEMEGVAITLPPVKELGLTSGVGNSQNVCLPLDGQKGVEIDLKFRAPSDRPYLQVGLAASNYQLQREMRVDPEPNIQRSLLSIDPEGKLWCEGRPTEIVATEGTTARVSLKGRAMAWVDPEGKVTTFTLSQPIPDQSTLVFAVNCSLSEWPLTSGVEDMRGVAKMSVSYID